jgi:hypothetical protein
MGCGETLQCVKRASVIVAKVAGLLCVGMSAACSLIGKNPSVVFGNAKAERRATGTCRIQ